VKCQVTCFANWYKTTVDPELYFKSVDATAVALRRQKQGGFEIKEPPLKRNLCGESRDRTSELRFISLPLCQTSRRIPHPCLDIMATVFTRVTPKAALY